MFMKKFHYKIKSFEEVLNIYPEDSAARIMQTEYCSVSPDWTVGETIDYLRETDDLPKEFLQIFIVDNKKLPLVQFHLQEF